MSSRTLFKLSGLALLIALPLQILGFVLHPPSEQVVDVLKPIYRAQAMIRARRMVACALILGPPS